MTEGTELSMALRAAIGDVAIESARLEYWVASLVMHLDSLTDEEARQLLGRSGGPRRRLQEIVAAGTAPAQALARVADHACAVLDDRNRLLHSVVMLEETDQPGEERAVWWHPRSDVDLADVTVDEVREHVRDIARVCRQIAKLTDELAAPNSSQA